LFFVLGSVSAMESADAAALPQATLKLSSVGTFVRSLFADAVALPRQTSGTAAGRGGDVSGAATRAGKGTGHAPGKGVGELPAYAPAAKLPAPGMSAAVQKGYDAKTSKIAPSRSTRFATWYQNADGSLTERISQTPVNYQDANGAWHPIQPTLAKEVDGRWHQKANGFGLSFAGGASAGTAAERLEAGGGVAAKQDATGALGDVAELNLGSGESVGWALAGANDVAADVSADGQTVSYPGILNDTTLSLTSESFGVDESLILSSASAPNSWTFPLTLTGVSLAQGADGAWQLVDASGSSVATLGTPGATDANIDPHTGEPTSVSPMSYSLATVGGVEELTMTLDPTWLASSARVFPVTVDPTVSIDGQKESTYVDYAFGNQNYLNYMDQWKYLNIGYDGSDIDRSYLMYPASQVSDTGYHITDAQFAAFEDHAWNSSSSYGFTVLTPSSSWDPTSITWNNQPTGYFQNLGTWTDSPASLADTCNSISGRWDYTPLNAALMSTLAVGGSSYYGLELVASSEAQTSAGENYWKYFASSQISGCSPYLSLTYTADVKPQVNTTSPPSGYASPTLTPALSASGSDADNWPDSLHYEFQVYDGANDKKVADSNGTCGGGTGTGASSWTVPAGDLKWGQSYYWAAAACDGYAWSPFSASSSLVTAVPPPLLTSELSQDSSGHGFDPALGNFTTSATDAQVATVGPALEVTRDYNSLDPRVGQALGAGWSSLLDARAAEQYSAPGSSAVASVTVTYPDGSEVGFGKNADGSFSPPLGRYATLAAVTGGYTLTDKNDTVYTFTHLTATGSGVYQITAVTDAAGRKLEVQYSASTGGQTTELLSDVSRRALYFGWITPSGASVSHVHTVSTDPVTSGGTTGPLTWTYYYDNNNDQLTRVCAPTSSTACTTYAYTPGSQYRTAQLDGAPIAYWPLSESSYGSSGAAADQVLANEHAKDATYASGVTFGATGPLQGSSATGVSLNGTGSAYVALPQNLVTGTTYAAVSLWFKRASTSASGPLFCEQNTALSATPTNATCSLYIGTDGKLHGQWYAGSTTKQLVSAAVINDTAWHHVVLSGADTTQQLYLDGAAVSGTALSGQINNLGQNYAYIGAGYNSGAWAGTPSTAGNWFFNGSVSDVAVYNSALPASTAASLHTAGVTATSMLMRVTRPSGNVDTQVAYSTLTGRVTQVTDSNGHQWQVGAPTVAGSAEGYRAAVMGSAPTDYWRLGDSAGAGTAYDEVAADGANATYSSAVTLGVTGPLNSSQTAASFNGTSTYVSAPVPWLNGAANVTVSLWFKTGGTTQVLFSTNGSPITGTATGYTPELYVGADGKLVGQWWTGDAYTPVESPTAVNDNVWHQAVLSGSGTMQTLYLDGKAVGSKPGTIAISGASYDYIGAGFIGGTWPDESNSGNTGTAHYLSGSVAEVALYHSALSGSDVAAQYAAAKNAAGLNPTVTVKVADPATALAPIAFNDTTYSASSNQTWTGRSTRLVFQSTGNLVLQRIDTGAQIWASGTSGYPSATLKFQSDGNVVIYNGSTALWATGTNYNPGNTAVLMGDGDLVIDDTAGRQLWESGTTIPGAAGVLLYEYDPVNGDRQVAQYDGAGAKTTYGYDSSGFLHTVVNADGDETITGHDVRGNMVSQTTCQNQATNACSTSYFTYDPTNNTTAVIPPNPSNDMLATATDARGSGPGDPAYTTTYGHDQFGDRSSMTTPPVPGYPHGRTANTTYTDGTITYKASDDASKPVPAGLPWTQTSTGGAVSQYHYNADGDLYSVTSPSGGMTTVFTYDQLGRPTAKTANYNTAGNCASGCAQTGLTTISVYDGQNRAVSVTAPATMDAVNGNTHQAQTTTGYDVDGNVYTQTISDVGGSPTPDAPRTSLTHYNALGQIDWSMDAQQYIDGNGGSPSPNLADATQFQYDSYGRKSKTISAQDQNGRSTVTDYAYDGDGRLTYTTLENYTGSPSGSQNPASLVQEARSYDPAGRLASVADGMGYSTLYQYYDDNLTAKVTRCQSATISNGTATCTGNSFVQESDSYDNAGDLTKSVTNNGTTETDYAFDAAGRQTQSTLDPTGLNRTTTKTYNADDLVVSQRTGDAVGSATTDYGYNADGAMTSQSVENYTTGAPSGWWKLNDGAAGASTPTTARDWSGNNNTATLSSTGATWASGAVSLNGTTGMLSAPATAVNTAASYTVSAWVDFAATPTVYSTVVSAPGSHNSAFYLQYSSASHGWAFLTTSADAAGEAQYASTAAATPVANTWYHLVGVYNSATSSVQLYVNNVAATSATASSAWSGSQGLSIGSAGSGNYVNGQVANVQVYPRALTSGEISTLYANGRTGSAVSAPSNTTTWSLDGRDLPLAMTDADGNTTQYVYDAAGHRTTTAEPAVATGTYTPAGGYSTVSPGPPTTYTGFDTFGEVAESKDPTGIEPKTTYDADGRPTATLLPDYQQPGSTYSSLLTGKESKTQYNELGETTATWDPTNTETTYTYDQLGHQTSSTLDPGGLNRTTSTQYDADGDATQITDPAGTVQSAVYDYLGRTSSTTRVYGIGGDGSTEIPVGCQEYNNVATQAACTTTNAYTDTAGFLSQTTDPSGDHLSYGYDGAGEQTSVTDGASQTTTTGYDYAGRAVRTTYPDGTYTTASYNPAGLQTAAAQYDSSNTLLRQTSAVYDGDGNVTSSTDANGSTTHYNYDQDDRLTGESQPASYTSNGNGVPSETSTIGTSFGYDAAGRQTEYIDGNRYAWYTAYNSWGLPELSVEPASQTYTSAATSTFTTTYDADGRAVEQDAPAGTDSSPQKVVQAQTYDNAGDVLTQSGSSSDAADAPTATRTFTYYNNGLLHTAATSNTSTGTSNATSDTLTYDDAGDLASTGGTSGTGAFTYTPAGQMASRTDTLAGTNYTTGYTYDSAERLKTIADPLTGNTLTYTYTPNSLDYNITYGSSGDTRYLHYNSAHELVSDALETPSTYAFATIAYGYDANGNETSKATSGYTDAATNTYTYDQDNRLKSWNNGSTVVGYEYDVDSNRTGVAGITYTYDARDELLSDGSNNYAYTARGTLKTTTNASGATNGSFDAYGQAQSDATDAYTYDALGRVVKNGTTAFDYTGTGNTLSYDGYTTYSRDPSGGLVADMQPTYGAWLDVTDQHGDLVGYFGSTMSYLIGSVAYDPLGAVLSKIGHQTSLGYQSEYTSPATGKVDMAARWYNPANGEFASKDTASNSPVPNSANANPFAYANDDPLTGTDPSGHTKCDVEPELCTQTPAARAAEQRESRPSPCTSDPNFPGCRATTTATTTIPTKPPVTKPHVVADAKPACRHGGSGRFSRTTCTAQTNGDPTGVLATGANIGTTLGVFAGCDALGGGPEDLLADLICGFVAASSGGAAGQGVECQSKGGDQCSAGAFVTSMGTNAAFGLAGSLTGALACRLLCSAISGDLESSLLGSTARTPKTLEPDDSGKPVVDGPSVPPSIVDADSGATAASDIRGAKEAAKQDPDPAGTTSKPKKTSQTTPTTPKSGSDAGSTNVDTQTATPVVRSVSAAKVEPSAPEAVTTEPDAPGCIPHSFTGSTPVLMADGSVKPIDQIKVGDQITNAAPGGTTETHKVDNVIVTTTDHDFVALSVAPVTVSPEAKAAGAATTAGNGLNATSRAKIAAATLAAAALLSATAAPAAHASTAGAANAPSTTATLTTTYHHQFYDATTNQWTQAESLHPGDLLQTPTGYALIEATHLYHANTTTYDLTIGDLHTYYVVAGSTPVLVHNCGNGASTGAIPNTSKPVVGEYPDAGQTSLYVINDPQSGQILKFGITKSPATRYSLGDYADWNAQYGGNFQMNILRNFDTRDDALTIERYLTERTGGPENDEDWANTVPNNLPWDEVYRNGIRAWQNGEIGPQGAL
jgi:RHS repeat-associated protein